MGKKNESCNVSSCFLCSHCIPEWKDLIAVHKTTLRFKKGEQLFSEGEPVKGVYFMYSGAVKVHKHWIDQKELIIRFTKAGDMLGHRGLAAGDVYPVSATALEDSSACFISNRFLETTLKADHAFTNPEATEKGKKFNIPIAYNAAADSASWKDMNEFFGRIFK